MCVRLILNACVSWPSLYSCNGPKPVCVGCVLCLCLCVVFVLVKYLILRVLFYILYYYTMYHISLWFVELLLFYTRVQLWNSLLWQIMPPTRPSQHRWNIAIIYFLSNFSQNYIYINIVIWSFALFIHYLQRGAQVKRVFDVNPLGLCIAY